MGVEAHEGSHVADGESWIRSNFSPAMNPTRFQTEFRAFNVQANLYRAEGNTSGTTGMGGKRYLLFCCNSDVVQGFAIQQILAVPRAQGGLYGVTKTNQGGKAFVPFTPY